MRRASRGSPGGTPMRLHSDQWRMPPPVRRDEQHLRPGSMRSRITPSRSGENYARRRRRSSSACSDSSPGRDTGAGDRGGLNSMSSSPGGRALLVQ